MATTTNNHTTESMLNAVLADMCASPPTDSSSTEVVSAFTAKVVTTLNVMQTIVENLDEKYVEAFVAKFEAMMERIPTIVLINMLNETMDKNMLNTFSGIIDDRFKKMMPDDADINTMRDEVYDGFVFDCVWDISKLKSTCRKILHRIEEIRCP